MPTRSRSRSASASQPRCTRNRAAPGEAASPPRYEFSAGMRETTAFVDAGPVTLDAPSAHFDLLAIGGGPAGQKAAIQAAKLGKRAAIVERAARRLQRLQRHDPVQDAARGGAVPDRVQPARDLRAELSRQGRHHDGGPAHALRGREPARDRRHPRPARPQPRDRVRRRGELRRRRHRRDHRGRRPPPGRGRRHDRDRDRQPPRAAGGDRVRRGVDPRLRRHPQPHPHPAVARRRRSRRDRHRVRVDVRRRRHQGHGHRLAARAAAVLRLRDRARAAALAARPRRGLPPRRDGRGRRAPRERRADHAQERQADRGRDGALLGRPPGRDRRPRPRADRRRDRRARADPGRRGTARASRASTPSAT